MNHIYIEHNPFIVESRFLINGKEPADSCKLNAFKEVRLQMWVENIFDELKTLFNGENNLSLKFKGTESDFLDLSEAAEIARNQGMSIDLTHIKAKGVEHKLNDLQSLINEAKSNPSFSRFLESDNKIQSELEKALNNDFNLYVVATMSSGKSTLINALLGQDLLPAANEATTATIAQITDDKSHGSIFLGKRIDNQGNESETLEVSAEIIKEWNRMQDTDKILLNGNIQSIKERDNVRLVITDTPGPNNSQEKEHERITMSYIQDSLKNPLILYMLNASQLGVKDDKNLLGLVAQAMSKDGKQSKDRFIFIVNKIDTLDPENGENIGETLERVKLYLESNGIKKPMVYPVSANLARLLRKTPDTLTRKESGDLKTMTEQFLDIESMNLPSYMPLTSKVRSALNVKTHISQIECRSGLPAVETVIDEYIDKYTLPNRLKRAYDAFSQAIEKGLLEARLNELLDVEEKELGQLKQEIQNLETKRKQGADTESYKQRLKQEGQDLPSEIIESFNNSRIYISDKIRNIGLELQKDPRVSPEQARKQLESATNDVEFLFKEIENQFKSYFQASQEILKHNLKKEYHHYVKELFDNAKNLKLPLFQGLQECVSDFSLDLKDDDIKTVEECAGQREVSDWVWYKPWEWGRKRIVFVYETVEYVDLIELWNEKISEIRGNFMDLQNLAEEKANQDKDNLIEYYLLFIEHEFQDKFDALIQELEDKLSNKERRDLEIKKARAQKEWIKDFKGRLDMIMSLE